MISNYDAFLIGFMRFLLILCVLYGATGAFAPAYSFVSKQDAQDYRACTAQINVNPTQALDKAAGWIKSDRS